jgi:hypothetical protein
MFCRATDCSPGVDCVEIDGFDGVLSAGGDGAGSESGRLLVDGWAGGSGPGGACACMLIAPAANRVLRKPRFITALALMVTAHLKNTGGSRYQNTSHACHRDKYRYQTTTKEDDRHGPGVACPELHAQSWRCQKLSASRRTELIARQRRSIVRNNFLCCKPA